jgi:predicted nucleotidyltransferase
MTASKMRDIWRTELIQWAQQYAERMAKREGILGVVIGGSLARGKEWRHSDLELGILVESRDASLAYFNVDDGRGVELIQVVRSDLEMQMGQVESGDAGAMLKWPIQLWQCKIIYDPTGLLARFKGLIDSKLFDPNVLETKLTDLHARIETLLGEARVHLSENRPAAALVKTRLAVNEAILALHWHFRELPRSQNRTDSRLRQLCSRHAAMPFYGMYRDVFRLSETGRVIRSKWPRVKTEVLEITRLWGDSARDFFIYAVDSDFAWRQRAGILTVYRLYIPIIGAEGQRLVEKLDDGMWADQHRDLMAFLGFDNASEDEVRALLSRFVEVCAEFNL